MTPTRISSPSTTLRARLSSATSTPGCAPPAALERVGDPRAGRQPDQPGPADLAGDRDHQLAGRPRGRPAREAGHRRDRMPRRWRPADRLGLRPGPPGPEAGPEHHQHGDDGQRPHTPPAGVERAGPRQPGRHAGIDGPGRRVGIPAAPRAGRRRRCAGRKRRCAGRQRHDRLRHPARPGPSTDSPASLRCSPDSPAGRLGRRTARPAPDGRRTRPAGSPVRPGERRTSTPPAARRASPRTARPERCSASYNGALYQVRRSSDNATTDIGVLERRRLRQRRRPGLVLLPARPASSPSSTTSPAAATT